MVVNSENEELKNPEIKISNLAILSLLLGILSLPFSLLTGIPAIICGHMANNSITSNPQIVRGKLLALTGLVMGYLSILITAFLLVLIFTGNLMP